MPHASQSHRATSSRRRTSNSGGGNNLHRSLIETGQALDRAIECVNSLEYNDMNSDELLEYLELGQACIKDNADDETEANTSPIGSPFLGSFDQATVEEQSAPETLHNTPTPTFHRQTSSNEVSNSFSDIEPSDNTQMSTSTRRISHLEQSLQKKEILLLEKDKLLLQKDKRLLQYAKLLIEQHKALSEKDRIIANLLQQLRMDKL